MANEVIVANAAETLPVHSLQEMDWLAKMLSGTSMFGQTNPADSLAIVAMCHQERMSWMKFSQTYHWIKGRPSKKADAILMEFARIGGKKKIESRTAELAKCTFSLDGDEYTSELSWEQAKQEPFVYEGKESDVLIALANGGRYPNGTPLVLKSKYQTPRARMQMLWARCVSDGVRVIAPQCCCGVYTPEEVGDFDEDRPRIAYQPQPSAPQVIKSASPFAEQDPDVCPAGKLAGTRWADMDDATLNAALQVSAFTDEMKSRIKAILDERATSAEAEGKNENETSEE